MPAIQNCFLTLRLIRIIAIMKSVKDIYKIGKGPSSSHTMGPFKAVRTYMEEHPEANALHVTLYGSLAATGKGHLTDKAIEEAFNHGDVTIEW